MANLAQAKIKKNPLARRTSWRGLAWVVILSPLKMSLTVLQGAVKCREQRLIALSPAVPCIAVGVTLRGCLLLACLVLESLAHALEHGRAAVQ